MSAQDSVRLLTIDEFLESQGIFWDWGLSPGNEHHLAALRGLVAADLAIETMIPYTRYDSPEARVVALKYARDIGASELGFGARLTGSGMSAIRSALVAQGRKIVYGEVLYSLTTDYVRHLRERFGVQTYRMLAKVPPEQFLDNSSAGGVVMIFETIGNGMDMPVLDVEAMMRHVWNKGFVTFILDGTFTTCALLNPFEIYERLRDELGEPAFQFVYIESLSKHYRAGVDGHDHASGGIVVAPPTFLEKFDRLLVMGDAMPTTSLRGFPWHLVAAPEREMVSLSATTAAVVEALLRHPRVKAVHYPLGNPLLPKGAGGVFFMEIWRDAEDHSKGTITDPVEYEELLYDAGIEFRASFGHEWATCIGMLQRVSVGKREQAPTLIDRVTRTLNDWVLID